MQLIHHATVVVVFDDRAAARRAVRELINAAFEKDQIGVATGLAWTAVGGDVLFVEALRMKGKATEDLVPNYQI